MVQVFTTERIQDGDHGWYDTRNDTPVDPVRINFASGYQTGKQNEELILGCMAYRVYAPIFNQMITIVNAQLGVGIPDIYYKEHVFTPSVFRDYFGKIFA
jgi:hypothetical protein